MKKLIIFWITSIVVVGGVSAGFKFHFSKVSQMEKEIHPEFMPLYSKFIIEARDHGFDLSSLGVKITFADIPKKTGPFAKEGTSTLGECGVIIAKRPEIRIDQQRWIRMSMVQREMTLYHELGHCFLLKGHTSSLHENIHVSLMNPEIFDERIYVANREKYMLELFGYKPYTARDYLVTFFIKPGYERVYKFLQEKHHTMIARK